MNPHLQKAQLLVEQGRHELAEKEARAALVEDPGDIDAHCILAVSLVHQKKLNEAEKAAGDAIHLGPAEARAHYVMSLVLVERNRLKEATSAIDEAISLDPYDPDFHAWQAAIRFDLSDWKGALAAAEKGLELDAESTSCGNLRAMSLVKLGRREEAGQTIEATLAHDPGQSFSHSTFGWTHIEANDPKQALEHFREAIRLDPENEMARAGIVEALKAQNPIYRLILRYFLFMTKLSGGAQMAIIFGAWFLVRYLGGLKEQHPDWADWIFVVQIAYFGFVLMSWTAVPLFNLLLRLHPVGRHALTEEQTTEANWIGTVVGLGLASLAAYLIWGGPFLFGALMFFPMIFPLAGIFRCPEGWPRNLMKGITAVLALIATAGVTCIVMAEWKEEGLADRWNRMGTTLFSAYILAAVLSSWASNLLSVVRVRK